MNRFDVMDERTLLQMQEEEKQKNALAQMMRYGSPGKLPVRQAPYEPMTFMEQLQQAYDGLMNPPKTMRNRTIGIRG